MAFTRSLDNLVPIMTSNSAPSGYVASASSEYNTGTAAWKAFTGVASSDRWLARAPTGWLAIEFPSSLVVNSYKITSSDTTARAPSTFTFDGWTGSAWTTLDTQTSITGWTDGVTKTFTFNNTTAYIKYRINVTANNGDASYLEIGELELLATGAYASLIPVMTSNTAPYGTASASSASASYPTWMAFKGTDTNEGWEANAVSTGWLAYEFPVAKTVKQYSIYPRGAAAYPPKTWTFDGWNGSSWVTLDTQTNINSWLQDTAKTFSIPNTTAYIKYRINVTESLNGVNLAIESLRMFGYGQPVHRYQLKADANDSGAGTAVNLTNNGSVTFSEADGASMSGTSQYLSFTNTISPNATICGWFTIPQLLGWVSLIDSGIASSPYNQYGLEVNSSGTIFYMTGSNTSFTGATLSANTRYFVALTKEGTLYKGYINSTANGSSTGSETISTNWGIGGYIGGSTNGLKAKDARIYDYPLTASEIAALVALGPNNDTRGCTLSSAITQPSGAWTVDFGGKNIYVFNGSQTLVYKDGALVTTIGGQASIFPLSQFNYQKSCNYVMVQSVAIDSTEVLHRSMGRIKNGASQLLYLDMAKFNPVTGIVPDVSGAGNYATLSGGSMRRVAV